MRGTVLRYRVMAYITGVVLMVFCFVGIPLQIAGHPALVNVVGTLHGLLYIIYLVAAALLAWKLRLRLVPPCWCCSRGPSRPDVRGRALADPAVHQPGPGRGGRRGPACWRSRSPGPDRVSPDPASDHYFTARPGTAHRPGRVHVLLPDVHLELETDSGVLSPSRGRRHRLLPDVAATPDRTGGRVDLGAGHGPIALVWPPGPRPQPYGRWTERAGPGPVRPERRTGRAVQRALCAARDPALPATFAGIWSNPPIRIGKQALHDLLGGWLPRLAPGAAACAVVQRHLGSDSLHRWPTEQGWAVNRIASRAGYRVLRIEAGEAS